MKILISIAKNGYRGLYFPPEVIEKLQSLGEIVWNDSEKEFSDEELREKLKDTDILFTGWGTETLGIEVLECADRLKMVAHAAGSVIPIISDYLFSKNIKIISGNNVFAESVAEAVIGFIISTLRHVPHFNNEMHKGNWKIGYTVKTEGLLDQTVGLVGFGAISRELIKMLQPFRTHIIVHDPFVDEETLREYGVKKAASLDEIFAKSKIISLHVPRKPETYHLIDSRLLSMIQDGALLINTARGDVIDEKALEEELLKNRFKVFLDVYESEPLPRSSKLIGLDNAILMPHLSVSMDRYKYVTLALIEDIQNYLEGRTLKNEINKSYAYSMSQ
jgi:phosphoglycerate dehydrogenase-like enzyme